MKWLNGQKRRRVSLLIEVRKVEELLQKKRELCFGRNWAQKLTFGPYIMYI